MPVAIALSYESEIERVCERVRVRVRVREGFEKRACLEAGGFEEKDAARWEGAGCRVQGARCRV